MKEKDMCSKKNKRVSPKPQTNSPALQPIDLDPESQGQPDMIDMGFSVDDTIALLLQLDAENILELAQIKADVETHTASLPPTDPIKEYLHNALTLLESIINKTSIDPIKDLDQVLASLDAARKMPLQSGSAPAAAVTEPSSSVVSTEDHSLPADPSAQNFTLPADADASLIQEFVTECKDLLEKAEAALLLLEANPDDMDSVNTVFRTFHTVKGTSGFLGLLHIQEFGHFAESLFSRMREREIRCEGIYADLALRSTDVLKELTDGVHKLLAGEEAALPASYHEVKAQLQNPEAAATTKSLENKTPRAGTADRPEASIPPKSESVALQKTDVPAKTGIEPATPDYSGNTQKVPRKAHPVSEAETTLRVRTDRLDRLVDMTGELVIAQSMLSQDSIVHQSSNIELLRKVTHAGKIVRELQDLAMSMRMVPLKGVFQKVARLVRDLAHKSGKPIEFISEGEDTEIDRNMVDVLGDPLVHMVRNSIDHGIEQPDVRSALGKPPVGTVQLAAYHSGGNVVLELRDDGKGLDRDKIVQKAIAKGLLDSEKNLSDSEALKLIFLPGFSTADKITEISGRGVGMDVVRKNVESLRGRIDLNSEAGKGCTFFIRLPLTLAITDGMLVKVGCERYIIPTVNIHLSFKPEPSALSTVSGKGELVMLRGELMPVYRLHSLFDIQGAITNPTEGLLVIVGEGDKRYALLVDELIGQQQVVAKSLGEGMAKIQGIAGAAILGDGKVGLILDASELVSLAHTGETNGLESQSRNAA
jgi:two-component system chemotaxis sensor kinase CheA